MPYTQKKDSPNRDERIEAKLDEVLEYINGTNETPGIKVRLDRVEQFVGAAKWVIATVVGALLTIGTGVAWAIAKSKGGNP